MKAAPTGSSALGFQGCRLCPLTPICKPTPRTRGLRKVSKHSPRCPMCSTPGTARPMAQSVHPPGTNPSRSLPKKCHGLLHLSQGSPRASVPLSQRGRPCLKSTQGSLTCPNWPWLPPPGAGLFPAGHPTDQPFRGPKIAPQSHVCPSTDRKLFLYIATITIHPTYVSYVCLCHRAG